MAKTLQATSKRLAWLSVLLAATAVVMLVARYRFDVGPFAVTGLCSMGGVKGMTL